MARPGAARNEQSDALRRIVPGSWPLSKKLQEAHQRGRVLIPVARMAHRDGIARVGVTEMCTAAHISRNTFYRLFGNREGGLEYAFAAAFARILGPVELAVEPSGPWLGRVDAALGALFEGIAEEPLLAELCLVHSAGAAKAAEGNDLEAAVAVVARILAPGRGQLPGGAEPPGSSAVAAEWLACGVFAVATSRIRQGNSAKLPEHRRELVLLAANSLLGPEAAAQALRETTAVGQP
jgi:AcrR family transcriptional regulator